MQLKPLLLIVGYAINFIWSAPPTQAEANAVCSPGDKQPTITHFNSILKHLLMSVDSHTLLDNYTDRQLGVFRISTSFKSVIPYFNIVPVSSRSSLIVLKCSDIGSQCSAALIVPNPWNVNGMLMRTINAEDYGENRSKFGGFNGDWVPIAVTNSSDGLIEFWLCDYNESVTFHLYSMGTAEKEDAGRCSEWFMVSTKWTVSCQGIPHAMAPVAEEIEAVIDRYRLQDETLIGGKTKLVVAGVMGAVVLVGICYMLVVKYVLRG